MQVVFCNSLRNNLMLALHVIICQHFARTSISAQALQAFFCNNLRNKKKLAKFFVLCYNMTPLRGLILHYLTPLRRNKKEMQVAHNTFQKPFACCALYCTLRSIQKTQRTRKNATRNFGNVCKNYSSAGRGYLGKAGRADADAGVSSWTRRALNALRADLHGHYRSCYVHKDQTQVLLLVVLLHPLPQGNLNRGEILGFFQVLAGSFLVRTVGEREQDGQGRTVRYGQEGQKGMEEQDGMDGQEGAGGARGQVGPCTLCQCAVLQCALALLCFTVCSALYTFARTLQAVYCYSFVTALLLRLLQFSACFVCALVLYALIRCFKRAAKKQQTVL